MDQNIRERLEAWIDAHFDELLADISALVAIPSVAGHGGPEAPYGEGCRRALDTALELAQRYGFETRNYENHCGSATLRPGKDAAEEIAFWGHLDVVPPGDGWHITPPYEPVICEGYLVGRGADDNKGPALGVMYLLRAFEELDIKTRHGLRLFMGCDEEAGMKDVTYYAANYPSSKLVIIPDCGFPACYGEKGIISADVVTCAPMETVIAAKNGMASNIVPDKASITLRGACAQTELGEYAAAQIQGDVADGPSLVDAVRNFLQKGQGCGCFRVQARQKAAAGDQTAQQGCHNCNGNGHTPVAGKMGSCPGTNGFCFHRRYLLFLSDSIISFFDRKNMTKL